jgi:hypothetical protein
MLGRHRDHACAQFGTDTGYFPAPSHAPTCNYVLDTGWSLGNSSGAEPDIDHTHF